MPPEDKDAALFPRQFDGRWALIHRPVATTPRHTADIWLSWSPDLRHWGDHAVLLAAREGAWWDAHKVGLCAPPLLTAEGWLLLYHGVRVTAAGSIYRLGLALLDAEHPDRVLARSSEWIFGPDAPYERTGDVGQVVFSCGWLLLDDGDTLRIYYGAADTSVCVATASLTALLRWLATPLRLSRRPTRALSASSRTAAPRSSSAVFSSAACSSPEAIASRTQWVTWPSSSLRPDLLERRRDGRDLGQDVDAVAVVLDHPLDPAHLPLDPVQALDERVLVLGVAVHHVLLPEAAEAPQAQAVGDDEHARERHRGGRDHRVEQPGDGERDRGDVVGERPEQVALDRRERAAGEPDRVDGGAQVAGHERQVARLDRDVGARADRDAEVGLGERRRVVDAVADHRDDLARAPAGARPRRPCPSGSTSAIDALDADLGGDRRARRARCRR